MAGFFAKTGQIPHLEAPPRKNFFEKTAWDSARLVCGIDEVGRGCLAGPVVVAAAILPSYCKTRLIKDSKKLSAQEREKAFSWLTKNAIFSVAIASNYLVDQRNVYWATFDTMQRAYLSLIARHATHKSLVKYILTDAMPFTLPAHSLSEDTELRSFIHGEDHSSSIAAASIIAKVTRDRIMERLHPLFPQFGLDLHKGYATSEHQENLQKHGRSIIHRLHFAPRLLDISEKQNQESLF